MSCLPQGEQLGMSQRVLVDFAAIMGRPQDFAVTNHQRPNRNFSQSSRLQGLGECDLHPTSIVHSPRFL
jgi:hypothetical protein